MRIKSILTILLLLALSVNAQDSALQKQFETEIKTKNENVTSIECKFKQTRKISFLKDVVDKDGAFHFLRPGNMLLAFADGDHIKMTESWFEMKTGENVSSTKVSSNPMLKNLSSILSACVVGDFRQMTKGFNIETSQTESEWIVRMIPSRGKAASKISGIILHFSKDDMSLNILRMEEKSGDYTMYEFFDKRFNTDIDSNLFNIRK